MSISSAIRFHEARFDRNHPRRVRTRREIRRGRAAEKVS